MIYLPDTTDELIELLKEPKFVSHCFDQTQEMGMTVEEAGEYLSEKFIKIIENEYGDDWPKHYMRMYIELIEKP
jgi:hypothetical protein